MVDFKKLSKQINSPWKRHKRKWSNCQLCELHETRRNTVLLRTKGNLPTRIMFIGEAPGRSEDDLGKPFKGKAGHLLDIIINDALRPLGLTQEEVRMAFTNLIACIPLDMDGEKVNEPHKDHIHACADRLEECIQLCRPQAIVMVGKLSEKWVPKLLGDAVLPAARVGIIHPGAILKADVSQQGLAAQQAKIRIRELVQDIYE